MDGLPGRVVSIDDELRRVRDSLRNFVTDGVTPARKVKPPGTKVGREHLLYILGCLDQLSADVGGIRTHLLPSPPHGPDTPLSYGSPAVNDQNAAQDPLLSRGASSQDRDMSKQPSGPATPDSTSPPTDTPRASGVPAFQLIRQASLPGPVLSNHASPLFSCIYRDINILNEDFFEECSRHPVVRDRGYFKLQVHGLPPLKIEKMNRPTKDHATSFIYKTDAKGLITVDTGKRVRFNNPRLPFPRTAKAEWSFEDQRELWNTTAKSPPTGTRPYIIGNPLFTDVELSPGEKLKMRGRGVLEGINSQYVYFNLLGKTITTMHREDAHVRSENLLRSGENKFWCFVKPSSSARLEEMMKIAYPAMRNCSQAVRHLSLHIPPAQLDEWGIEYTLDYCVPGQAVVTEPGTYHQVLNLGPNYAIAVNVEYLSSPDEPINYTFCDDLCPDKTAISAEDFRLYPEKPTPPATQPASTVSTGSRSKMARRQLQAPASPPEEPLSRHPPLIGSSSTPLGQSSQPSDNREYPAQALSQTNASPLKEYESAARELSLAGSLPQGDIRSNIVRPNHQIANSALLPSYTPQPVPAATTPIDQQGLQAPATLSQPAGPSSPARSQVLQMPSGVQMHAPPSQMAMADARPGMTEGAQAHPVSPGSRIMSPPNLNLSQPSSLQAEQPVPSRPAGQAVNPFTGMEGQPAPAPFVMRRPLYASETFAPVQPMPVLSAPQQSPRLAPSPILPPQSPAMQHPGGGHSPKTIQRPGPVPPPGAGSQADEGDLRTKAAAALASMVNSPRPTASASKKRPAAKPAAMKVAKKPKTLAGAARVASIPLKCSPVPLPPLPFLPEVPSPNKTAYQKLSAMLGSINRAPSNAVLTVDSMAAFHRVDNLLKGWRGIQWLFPQDSSIFDLINKVDEMPDNTAIHVFLRRFCRMKLAGLSVSVGDTEEARRRSSVENSKVLLDKLGWTDQDLPKLHTLIREGKCWKTICSNKDEGILCILPLDSEFISLTLFAQDVARFADHIHNNSFIRSLAAVGNLFQKAIANMEVGPEFVWEQYDTRELAASELEPLLAPYTTLKQTHYDPQAYPDWPQPANWRRNWAWPSDPAAVPPGEKFCQLCKRRNGCTCAAKRMADVARVSIDGPKGEGVRSQGTHNKGQLLGELMGELTPPGTYSQFTVPLRRPDVGDSVVADIYTGRRGNWVRKVNHNVEPTAKLQVLRMQGRFRLVLVALRDIQDGEEITVFGGRGYAGE
ncbi:hypothetical protein OQA88_7368 [Cercophora sp. LCS_1]